MQIITPQDFTLVIKNHNLLLDTNIFIDALINPTQITRFLNELKKNGCVLFTTELVTAEFIRGDVNLEKINKKEKIIADAIESYLSITKDTSENVIKLLKLYKEDSKSLSITDLILGSFLMQYPGELFLISKNTADFPTNIFRLETFFTLVHRKALQNYGIYSFPGD